MKENTKVRTDKNGSRALAREYRPRAFEGPYGIIAQPHVTTVLKRQVETGSVAQALLFTGTRGVGKTTAARVLAMALNCQDRAAGEPCGQCDTCRRIVDGRETLDVREMDAATNRGVDDARALREQAMYSASEPGRYKVYIVDEAHMLTKEAWNALLKILEEPPPRVIFVFCTTDPQKIQQSAAPILSRCQRYDFRPISVADVAAHLGTVAEREGIATDDKALLMLARRSGGSMRDALRDLDQARAFRASEAEVLSADVVRKVFNVADERVITTLLSALAGAGEAGGENTLRKRIFDAVDFCRKNSIDAGDLFTALNEAMVSLCRLHVGAHVANWSEGGLTELMALKGRLAQPELAKLLLIGQESARALRESGAAAKPDDVLTLFLLQCADALEALRVTA